MASSNNDSSTSSSAVIIDGEAFQCSICYNDFGDVPYVLLCGHSFCLYCIENIKNVAIGRNETVFKCPMCSSTQDVNSKLIKNYAFRFIRDHMKSTDDLILQSSEYKTLQELNDKIIIENNTTAESQKALKEENQKLQADLDFEKNRSTEFQEVINRKKAENAIIGAKLEILERENEKLKMDVKDKEELQEAFDYQEEQFRKALEAEKKKAQKKICIQSVVTACLGAYFLYHL